MFWASMRKPCAQRSTAPSLPVSVFRAFALRLAIALVAAQDQAGTLSGCPGHPGGPNHGPDSVKGGGPRIPHYQAPVCDSLAGLTITTRGGIGPERAARRWDAGCRWGRWTFFPAPVAQVAQWRSLTAHRRSSSSPRAVRLSLGESEIASPGRGAASQRRPYGNEVSTTATKVRIYTGRCGHIFPERSVAAPFFR